ncbi:MAG: dehydrogenase [Pseudomonadota bacterium]|jgi:NAD(P)-dependent dehydrogenase (short-subunit alcohol dehydrogenase family)
MTQSTSAQSTARVAVVTGAGSGIGAAVAKRLGKRGFRVILGGRTPGNLSEVAAEIRSAGGQAEAITADVTLASDVERLIQAAGPHLDVLVHSAGQGHCLTIDELDEEEFRQTLDVAVTGAFLTTKAALGALRASPNGPGHVVQVCSLASGGTWYKEVGYGVAKAAQLKFALHLSEQFKQDATAGGRTIYVHGICPGTVDTPFWARVPQRTIDPQLCLRADEVAWLVEGVIDTPLATAEDFAAQKPRPEIVVKRHAPYERWSNVIAIAHESHP